MTGHNGPNPQGIPFDPRKIPMRAHLLGGKKPPPGMIPVKHIGLGYLPRNMASILDDMDQEITSELATALRVNAMNLAHAMEAGKAILMSAGIEHVGVGPEAKEGEGDGD